MVITFTQMIINSALRWKCNTSIDELKIDEDMYEIVKI